jgi:hypothetical protein
LGRWKDHTCPAHFFRTTLPAASAQPACYLPHLAYLVAVLRGKVVSRIEGFSDAVFGFALTLLVVSLEVPEDYADLQRILIGFPAFAVTFAIVCWVWYEHYLLFRRYDLEDGLTAFLNCVLLFIVVFYAYPMKFMSTRLISGSLFGSEAGISSGLSADDARRSATSTGAGASDWRNNNAHLRGRQHPQRHLQAGRSTDVSPLSVWCHRSQHVYDRCPHGFHGFRRYKGPTPIPRITQISSLWNSQKRSLISV